MGAPYMDYLVADAMIIPADNQGDYAEKIIYLPCYQVNTSKREKSATDNSLERSSVFRPRGFVFSCF